MKNRIHISGFTLVELLVTMSIAAVLLSVAIPSFRNLIDANEVNNTTARLANTFAYARSEAVARSEDINVCASTDGLTCNAVIAASWNDRWLVTVDATGEVLRVEDVSGLNITVAIMDNLNVVQGGIVRICFNRLGEECIGAFLFVTFTVTGLNGQTSTTTLNRNGAVGL
jgi:prepilin-type N-terminal cleavage/methylation domain-containing protein